MAARIEARAATHSEWNSPMTKIDITPELLRQMFNYDSAAGHLIWLNRHDRDNAWNARYAGKVAGCINSQGYVVVVINAKIHNAHRIMWAIYHGEYPKHNIDHINGNRTDNRICNLRDVSNKENLRNQKLRVGNKSGSHGVYRMRDCDRWSAEIRVDGKKIHLGLFKNRLDAIEARKKAEKDNGYHENHGAMR